MQISDSEIEVLRLGALLHDIGKIGISDNILGKAGALTDDEYEIIKSHPVLGAQILRTVAFLEPHLPIVELHHEQPDGLGYPHGLKGEQVPLLARIVHVADAFDAMTTARAYRAGRPGVRRARRAVALRRHPVRPRRRPRPVCRAPGVPPRPARPRGTPARRGRPAQTRSLTRPGLNATSCRRLP